MEFFSIGVYNSTESEFFDKLKTYDIDLFCDIRQRRGVRGSKYAFVNSKRLQTKLSEIEINYSHIIDLAPTAEIRQLQKEADVKSGELKRSRSGLGKVFVLAYKNKILSEFDFNKFITNLEAKGAKRILLFCVEELPQACHRSIVTDKLMKLGYAVKHI